MKNYRWETLRLSTRYCLKIKEQDYSSFLGFEGSEKKLVHSQNSWDKYRQLAIFILGTKINHRVWKSTEKVAFNMASEASYVYILSEQCQKMVHFGDFSKTWNLLSISVTRQVNLKWPKTGWKCQNANIQMRHFGFFQTLCNVEILRFSFPKLVGTPGM